MAATNEIEYKFLIADLSAVSQLTPIRTEEIIQGYLTKPGDTAAIRVRASKWQDGKEEAYITVKGPAIGMTRKEFEYEIPLADAREMMQMPGVNFIDKTRYFFDHGAHTIELDVFNGALAGLVVAEIEVASEDEKVEFPDWFGENVTHDIRYTNVYLALHGLS